MQRADERAGRERVADRQRPVGRRQLLDQGVGDRLVHDQPAHRRAPLAGGAGGGEHDGAHGEVEVGRRRDDRGVVAAELEDGPAEAGGHPRRDRGAHPLRPGRADQRDTRAVEQRGGARRVRDDHRVQPVGRADLAGGAVEQRRRGDGDQRSPLRRLPHHRVAADQRDRGVPRPHRAREVERGDHADDPERVPGLHQPVPGPLRRHRAARRADGTARRRSRRCRSSPGPRRAPRRRSCRPRSPTRSASVVLVLGQQLAEPLDQPRRAPAPGTVRHARNAACAAVDRPLDVPGVREGHRGDGLAGHRADDVDASGAGQGVRCPRRSGAARRRRGRAARRSGWRPARAGRACRS